MYSKHSTFKFTGQSFLKWFDCKNIFFCRCDKFRWILKHRHLIHFYRYAYSFYIKIKPLLLYFVLIRQPYIDFSANFLNFGRYEFSILKVKKGHCINYFFKAKDFIHAIIKETSIWVDFFVINWLTIFMYQYIYAYNILFTCKLYITLWMECYKFNFIARVIT